jgi:pteridine reductase
MVNDMETKSASGGRRVALVTGGAKRVGRAVVMRLADGGYDVAFTYLSGEAEARELQNTLGQLGRKAVGVRADLTDPPGAVETIGDSISREFGRLDVLVNNASLYEPDRLGDVTLAQSRRHWAIHVESPMLLCQHFAPLLREAGGHVINMLDLLAERPRPQYLTYCASKAGLWNLTLSLARELAPQVTVNGIAPGAVAWPANFPEADRQKYLQRVPLGRPGTPEDVAQLVYFLCTGGTYLTGQIVRLDGGRSIT